MISELKNSLKEYLFTQNINKHHYPLKYWLKNRNLFIHLGFWIWCIWCFLTIFSIFLPVSNQQKLGRGAIVVFETVFHHIIKVFDYNKSSSNDSSITNTTSPIWNYEAYLFLYLTSIIVALGLYCCYLIKNFLYDLFAISNQHSIPTYFRRKIIFTEKFITFFFCFYIVLVLWTSFCFLYVKRPEGEQVWTILYKSTPINIQTSSKQYFRQLTTLGWCTAALNIASAFVILILYIKYSRETFLGNHFFFSSLRLQRETQQQVAIDPKIGKAIRDSMNPDNRKGFDHPNDVGYVAQLSGVNKYFMVRGGVFHALKNINLDIKEGEFVVILGYSGSGKTTLLNILAGIDRPTTGNCIISNCDLTRMTDYDLNLFRRKKIGYIFQNYALLPNLTAAENIAIVQGIDRPPVSDLFRQFRKDYRNNRNSEKRRKLFLAFLRNIFIHKPNRQELDDLLDTLNLTSHKDKYPNTLSGGQQQRVSIGRSLMKKPKILLADEPTAAIDHAMSKSILKLFKQINEESNTTVIMITHNPLIAKMAKRILYVEGGEIVRDEINLHPLNPDEINGL